MQSFRASLTVMTVCAAALVYPTLVAAQAKPPVCIAIALPSVQGVDGNATDVAVSVRESIASFLSGPSVKTMMLEARLASQAALEAQQKGCEQVLLPSVVRKAGGNKTGFLGKAAGLAATRTVYAAGAGAAAATAVVAGSEAMYLMASETRKTDEVEFGYRFGTPDTVAGAKPVSAKAKAQRDGEDLLTPLIEHATDGIVTSLSSAPTH